MSGDRGQAGGRGRGRGDKMPRGADAGCPHLVRTQAEVARWLRISVSAVKELRKAGLPGGRGGWDLLAIERWLRLAAQKRQRQAERKAQQLAAELRKVERNPDRRAAAGGGNGQPDTSAADLRAVRRRREELKLGRETGQLIPAQVHEAELVKRQGAWVAMWRSLPGRLASLLAGQPTREVRRRLQAFVRQVLRELYGEQGKGGGAGDAEE